MNIAIIGGGISGLSAGHFLSARGHKVTVFERDDTLGGLAASFDFGGAQIEKYYHFVCGGDDDLVELCDELDLGGKLQWRESRMSFFYGGKMYPFGTPLNLLLFSPVSLLGRIRFGLHVLYAKSIKDWKPLENESAEKWASPVPA